MIRPSQSSNMLIDVTNACHLHCSNCTRLLDHAKQRFFMSVECFERAVIAVRDYPYANDPHPQHGLRRRKVIGIMGGEPLLHPDFPALVDIMLRHVPHVYHRGLWTSIDWPTRQHPKWGSMRVQVERLLGPHPTRNGRGPSNQHVCGYICWNLHDEAAKNSHQPMLVASRDAVPDPKRRANLIEQCWVNREWSPTITPKGFFFCEVAGAMDAVFNGPGGLPIEPDVWRGDLTFTTDTAGVRQPVGKFADQVNRWCHQCGACLPMPGRRDVENRDDVSPSNLQSLIQVESPRVRRGEVEVHDFSAKPYDPSNHRAGWRPDVYVKGGDQFQTLQKLLTERGIS